jgi:hypothetical protein
MTAENALSIEQETFRNEEPEKPRNGGQIVRSINAVRRQVSQGKEVSRLPPIVSEENKNPRSPRILCEACSSHPQHSACYDNAKLRLRTCASNPEITLTGFKATKTGFK